MQTGVGWVDFSSAHRDRVRSVIDLLSAPGVVDELGVGVIRDAFADELFPGVSTIQTRPKYLVIIPRILKDYDDLPDRRRKNITAMEYLTQQEVQCRVKLATRYNFEQGLGVIGVTFRDRTDRAIQRPPSSVYWNGLCQFRIMRSNMSMGEYDRRYSGHRLSSRLVLEETKNDRGDDVDADEMLGCPIIPLPESDGDWMENLSITLTTEEARWLRNQIGATQADNLLGQIMLDSQAVEEVAMLGEKAKFNELLDLPSIQSLSDQRLLRIVHLAVDFWQLLRGAHIRYNVLLQQMYGGEEGQQAVQEAWESWLAEIGSFDWTAWNMEEVWQLVAKLGRHPHAWTRHFVDAWMEAVRAGASETRYDDLVRRQELANKKARARLTVKSADFALQGWVGFSDLGYRLPQVRQMALDIHRAETGEADPDVGL